MLHTYRSYKVGICILVDILVYYKIVDVRSCIFDELFPFTSLYLKTENSSRLNLLLLWWRHIYMASTLVFVSIYSCACIMYVTMYWINTSSCCRQKLPHDWTFKSLKYMAVLCRMCSTVREELFEEYVATWFSFCSWIVQVSYLDLCIAKKRRKHESLCQLCFSGCKLCACKFSFYLVDWPGLPKFFLNVGCWTRNAQWCLPMRIEYIYIMRHQVHKIFRLLCKDVFAPVVFANSGKSWKACNLFCIFSTLFSIGSSISFNIFMLVIYYKACS